MSQEFRSLPQAFAADQADELLLVAANPSRISVKSLRFDSLATLRFNHPADQSYGIGTADTWSNLPFNQINLSGSTQWVSLNADGSFALAPGCYFLESETKFYATNTNRLVLEKDGVVSTLVFGYASSAVGVYSGARLSEKFSLAAETNLRLRVSVSTPNAIALQSGEAFLAGYQATVAFCEIYKLG